MKHSPWSRSAFGFLPAILRTFPVLAFVSVLAQVPAQTIYIPDGIDGISTSPNSNVGIGTNTPGSKLDIGGPTGALYGTLSLKQSAGGQKGIWLQAYENNNALALFHTGSYGVITTDYTSSGSFVPLALQTTGGNVGIGTTAPHAKLQVMGDVRSYKDGADTISSHMYIGNAANSRAWNWQLTANGSSSIWGYDGSWWSEIVRFTATGNVGIGTANPTHKLAVKGTIRAYEVIVDTGWSDYVFADDYRLAPLAEVEAHIEEHRHLPGIPSAARVTAEGVNLGEMQSMLLAKVEELTLHLIRIEKENASLRERVQGLESAVRQEPGR